MNLSIVIPTVAGREDSLRRTIDAYERTVPGAQIIIEKDHPTVADAWNAGAARATGDILHLTADDLIPDDGWFEAATQTIAAHALPAPVLGQPTIGWPMPPPGAFHEPGMRDWMSVPATVIPTMPMSLWQEIGPIPSMHYWSDNLISLRARRAGWEPRVRTNYRFEHGHVEDDARKRMYERIVNDERIFRDEIGQASPKKILLTGGAGFIGSHLRGRLINAGHRVVVLDRHHFDMLDVVAFAAALAEHRPDRVVHLAASPGRVFGEDNPTHAITQNAIVTTHVAKACAAARLPLTYISTSEVYGDNGEATVDELVASPWKTHNIYGLTKLWGEHVCALYAPEGLQIIRPSMPYGPSLPAGRGRCALMNFLHLAAKGAELPVHRGSRRSWCWVGDTVAGMQLIIEKGEVAQKQADVRRGVGIYNVGRDDDVAMLFVAQIALELAGNPDAKIVEVDPGKHVSPVKRLSFDKLDHLGFRPGVSLEEGMRRSLPAARDYPAEW